MFMAHLFLDLFSLCFGKLSFVRILQAGSPWSKYVDVLPDMDEYTIHDYECEEFAALVTLNTHRQSLYPQMTTLFALLDRLWDVSLARYRVTQVRLAADAANGDVDITDVSDRAVNPTWGGAGVPPFRLCSFLVGSLPHLLIFITFSFFPFLIHFTYFLVLFILFLSTRIVPLRFQA